MRIASPSATATTVQKSEPFSALLRRWMERRGHPDTVKGRADAGSRLGVSHQTIANYLAGDLPPDTRVSVLADGLGVGQRKLRAIIDRDRARRDHAADGATEPNGATATSPVRP